MSAETPRARGPGQGAAPRLPTAPTAAAARTAAATAPHGVRTARPNRSDGPNRSPDRDGGGPLDRALADLPPELRWREWLGRIEAVLFASATPVGRAELARVVGPGVSVETLIADLRADLADRPYDVVRTGDAWMLRTRPRFADAVKAAADPGDAPRRFTEREAAVLCAIAYHQPIDRAGLAELFGAEPGRDLLDRLRARDLVATGPRSPRPGAPQTFVTTDAFLATFDLRNLRDLPDLMLHGAGEGAAVDDGAGEGEEKDPPTQ